MSFSCRLIGLITFLSIVSFEASAQSGNTNRSVKPTIYWSDGDSGRLGGVKFRLANIDAPETGSLKQRGGAKCEAERVIGYEAKAFLVGFARGKILTIEKDYGLDRYGRRVIDLSAGGMDVGAAGIEAGHLRPWPFKRGRALKPKPDWCAP